MCKTLESFPVSPWKMYPLRNKQTNKQSWGTSPGAGLRGPGSLTPAPRPRSYPHTSLGLFPPIKLSDFPPRSTLDYEMWLVRIKYMTDFTVKNVKYIMNRWILSIFWNIFHILGQSIIKINFTCLFLLFWCDY